MSDVPLPRVHRIDNIDITERQRKDFGDLTRLRESIRENGLIHPIVVEQQPDKGDGVIYRLVAGRRRLECLMQLKHEHVFEGVTCDPSRPGFVIGTEKDERQRQILEFEEDLGGRKDRTWQEKVCAIAKIHRMQWLVSPESAIEWGQKQTAEMLGISVGKVSYCLQLADEIMANPEGEVAKAEGYVQAAQRLVEKSEKEVRAEQERRRALAPQTTIPFLAESEPTPEPEETIVHISKMLFHGDFTEIAAADFPADHFEIAWVDKKMNKKEWKELLRLTKKNSFLLVRDRAFDAVTQGTTGITFMQWPVIWSILGHPENPYMPFADNTVGFHLLLKGLPEPVMRCNSRVFSANAEGDPEQDLIPMSVLEFLLRPLCNTGTKVLMPVGGPVLAVERIGRRVVAFETSKERHDKTVEAVKEHYRAMLPRVRFV